MPGWHCQVLSLTVVGVLQEWVRVHSLLMKVFVDPFCIRSLRFFLGRHEGPVRPNRRTYFGVLLVYAGMCLRRVGIRYPTSLDLRHVL